MKRQVAIVGPTPEFVRWSIRLSCPLREETDISSVDQTEKRLRAIRAAGQAIAERRVVEGIAIRVGEDDDANVKNVELDSVMAFRLDEVFSVWGGQQSVIQTCGRCQANLWPVKNNPAGEPINAVGQLAGCHGWLRRDRLGEEFIERLDSAWKCLDSATTGKARVLETRPCWNGFWADGELAGERLDLIRGLLRVALDQIITEVDDVGRNTNGERPIEEFDELEHFCLAADAVIDHDLTMDVELVPAGNSDGLRWTIPPFCGRCSAARPDHNLKCPVCGFSGGIQAALHRRVLGKRPYVPIAVLLGDREAKGLVEQLQKNRRSV